MSERVHVGVRDVAPTAEHGWLWRRVISFLFGSVILALFRDVILRTTDQNVLRFEALVLGVLLFLVMAFYLGGATLTDIWRLVSAVRTTRAITETRSHP